LVEIIKEKGNRIGKPFILRGFFFYTIIEKEKHQIKSVAI